MDLVSILGLLTDHCGNTHTGIGNSYVYESMCERCTLFNDQSCDIMCLCEA